MNTTPRIFFTSDCHFGHFNVIKYSNRPYGKPGEVFDSEITDARKAEIVHKMDEDMIAGWNEKVGQYDYVYIIGDMFFHKATQAERILPRLNGIKILIYGNHDKVIRDNPSLQKHFSETHEILERDFKIEGSKGRKIIMCHYAMRVWNKSHHGSLHLYGHSHGTLPDAGNRSMDVGVDTNAMRLYSLEDIIRLIGNRDIPSFDHHEAKDPR
jgi:calcineurin-like phosphoesterase family protein